MSINKTQTPTNPVKSIQCKTNVRCKWQNSPFNSLLINANAEISKHNIQQMNNQPFEV